MMNFFYSVTTMLFLILGFVYNSWAQCDINLGCTGDVFLSVDPPVFDNNNLSINFENVEIGLFSCNEANYTSGLVFYIYQLLPNGSRVDQCTVLDEAPFNIVGNAALNFGQSNFCNNSIPIGTISLTPLEGFEACDGALLQAEAVLYVTEQTNVDVNSASIYSQLPTNQYIILDLGTFEININDEFPGNGQPLTTAKLKDFSTQTDGPQTLTCGQNIELYVEGLSRLANCTPYNNIVTGIPSELTNEFYYQINGGQPIIIVDETTGAKGGQLTGPDSNLNGLCYAGLLNLDAPYVLDYNDLPQNLCNGSEVVFTLRTTDLFTNQTVEDTYTVIYTNGNAVCTQSINLNAGWNLISLDTSPNNNSIATVFASLQPGNLQFVTGFDNGAEIYDSASPIFLNTLSTIEDGFGYWVKVQNADVLMAQGGCIDDGFRKPLDAGWNLVAYPQLPPQSPAEYFADLINTGNLEFVTGFDNGTNIFNPDNPEILNSLKQLENGFGYWVKINNPAKTTNNLTNVFSFICGTSNLPVGQQVEVLNETEETIAILNVIEDSYLMTTPIYGDDKTTAFKENISIGENLRFSWNGQINDFTTTFKGDYGIEKVAIEFKLEGDAKEIVVKAYPVPANDVVNFEITLTKTTDLLLQIFDNKGSMVKSINNSKLSSGKQIVSYNVENLSAGIYTYQLVTGNKLSAGKFNIVR